jgi:hypothetical protein
MRERTYHWYLERYVVTLEWRRVGVTESDTRPPHNHTIACSNNYSLPPIGRRPSSYIDTGQNRLRHHSIRGADLFSGAIDRLKM